MKCRDTGNTNYIFDIPQDENGNCCLNKQLQNRSEICLLRSGINEHTECFLCYEGEIWEKYKIEKDEE